MSARQKFVKGSGKVGKVLAKGLVYLGKFMIAFLGMTAIIATVFLVSAAVGVNIPVVAAAASTIIASLAASPLLGTIIGLAVTIAAGEILKSVYKEFTEWAVDIYKDSIKNWFMPKNFDITKEELDVKQEKHSENKSKYANKESYVKSKTEQYATINKEKTADLELAGKAGKRAFKAMANGIADGVEWAAKGPSYMASFLPSFSYNTQAANDSNSNKETLLQDNQQPEIARSRTNSNADEQQETQRSRTNSSINSI